MHTNFSTCGAGGWLAPAGACAAPAWARWPYLEPWVATIAFFVWLALYKTLECGGDVRAAIRAQVDGDEKHVRVAGIGYFIGIYLFKQVAKPAEIDWSCPSPAFLLLETAVVVCVEIKILRRARAESSRRPPRQRRDACSMAWRCRFLTARRSQHGAPDALVG